MLGAKADGKPVQQIDCADQQRKVDNLFLGEMRTQCVEYVLGRMSIGDTRDRFGPGESGALALGIERRLLPGIEHVETLLGLTGLARVLAVDVETIGASVDL